MKWLDGWRSESKVFDQEGYEMARDQQDMTGWRAFVRTYLKPASNGF